MSKGQELKARLAWVWVLKKKRWTVNKFPSNHGSCYSVCTYLQLRGRVPTYQSMPCSAMAVSESRLPCSDSPLYFVSLGAGFSACLLHPITRKHTRTHATGGAGPSSSWGHQFGRAQGWFQDAHRGKIKIASTESVIGLPNVLLSQLASVYGNREDGRRLRVADGPANVAGRDGVLKQGHSPASGRLWRVPRGHVKMHLDLSRCFASEEASANGEIISSAVVHTSVACAAGRAA